jgi:hypothetical protein
MLLTDVFLGLGEEAFLELVRSISIGRLKTYQMYEQFKTRTHLAKLNTESLRKAVPRFWSRISAKDEDFAKDLAQVILLSHLEMIRNVLDFLGVPNQDGFFAKDLDASAHLTEGWQQRVYEKFHGTYAEPALLLYINHLAWELDKGLQFFAPAA